MRDLIVRFGRTRARLLRRLAGPGERGAIGVLVAVLIAGGALFGIGALVIDTGQLYQNRAELQNGADAGALAVAKSCATGTCTPSSALSTAQNYANLNASQLTGHTAKVTCVGGSSLGNCASNPGLLTNCPAAPSGTNYVDVQTSTLDNGSTLLPPVFSKTLAGNGNYQGSTVYACAQVEWGAPSSATTIAVTISACSWDVYTSQGTSYASPPPYPPNTVPAASFDHAIQLHGNGSTTGCSTEPAGADAPGNFGWTDDSGTCSVTITGNTYHGNTGTSASNACKTALANDYTSKSLLFIPVYVSVSGTGANATYTLKGFAAFVLTGYHLPGVSQSDWLNPANDCKGNNFCINGYFTQGLIPSAGAMCAPSSPTCPNLGADIIKLTG